MSYFIFAILNLYIAHIIKENNGNKIKELKKQNIKYLINIDINRINNF